MNYKSTAMKCDDCDYEFWSDEPEKARCPKCHSKYTTVDQKRDDDYTERLATGHNTC